MARQQFYFPTMLLNYGIYIVLGKGVKFAFDKGFATRVFCTNHRCSIKNVRPYQPLNCDYKASDYHVPRQNQHIYRFQLGKYLGSLDAKSTQNEQQRKVLSALQGFLSFKETNQFL